MSGLPTSQPPRAGSRGAAPAVVAAGVAVVLALCRAGAPALAGPPTSGSSAAGPSAPADIRILNDGDPEATPTPASPVTSPEDDVVAALDVAEGLGHGRLTLFSSGTLVQATTFRGRTTIQKKRLSLDEVDVVRRVVSEALALPNDDFRSAALGTDPKRRTTLEIGRPGGGPPRVFLIDELSSLPLALGRARGAMGDLRQRFLVPDPQKEWDAADVEKGTRLRRRADGKWFVVVRSDEFERGLELEDVSERLERLFLPRDEVPRLFDAPAPAATPTPQP